MVTPRALPITLVLLALACGPPALELGSPTETAAEGADSSGSETAESSGSETETGDGTTTSTTSTTTSDPSFVSTKFDLPGDNDCDAYAQDCPEGEKCVPYASTGGSWDDHKCVPIMGDQATGEPCVYGGAVEATDDCDGTGMCWDVMLVDGEPIGTCHSFCTGSPEQPECPAGSECLIAGDSTLNICFPGCDPLIQDCGPGSGCYYTNSIFICVFTTQDIPAGEPCGFINDCAAGLICLDAEQFSDCAGSTCCSAFCELESGDGQCELIPGTSCVPLFDQDEAPPGYEHVGVCVVPEP